MIVLALWSLLFIAFAAVVWRVSVLMQRPLPKQEPPLSASEQKNPPFSSQ